MRTADTAPALGLAITSVGADAQPPERSCFAMYGCATASRLRCHRGPKSGRAAVRLRTSDRRSVQPARVIEGRGGALIPGLIDDHEHMSFSALPLMRLLAPDLTLEAAEAAAAGAAEQMLRCGFTAVRDAGGPMWGLNAGGDAGKHRGASQIKVMAGGGTASDYDPLDVTRYTLDELRAAVEAVEDGARRRSHGQGAPEGGGRDSRRLSVDSLPDSRTVNRSDSPPTLAPHHPKSSVCTGSDRSDRPARWGGRRPRPRSRRAGPGPTCRDRASPGRARHSR